jgi:hypothetical protein
MPFQVSGIGSAGRILGECQQLAALQGIVLSAIGELLADSFAHFNYELPRKSKIHPVKKSM